MQGLPCQRMFGSDAGTSRRGHAAILLECGRIPVPHEHSGRCISISFGKLVYSRQLRTGCRRRCGMLRRRLQEISRDAIAWGLRCGQLRQTCGLLVGLHSLGIFTVLRSNRFCVAVSWFVCVTCVCVFHCFESLGGVALFFIRLNCQVES